MNAINFATDADLPALITLQRGFYAEEGYPYDTECQGAALADLLREPTLGRVWVATREGQPVGYLVLTYGYSVERGGRIALVDELFVRADSRGLSLGSLLLAAAEAHCQAAGIGTVLLEVERQNVGARRLYARFGFHAFDRDVMAKAL